MTTYAVTAVTGRFGQVAVRELAKRLQPGDALIALARNVDKAAKLVPTNVPVRIGDYDNEQSLAQSLAGIDRLLFISGQPGQKISRAEQHQNVVNAAKTAGVKFIAYTSFPQAPTNPAPLAADHKATEEAITASGIAHSFLRNNWYLENESSSLKAGAAGRPVVYSAADGQAGWALEREYAEAAANVLTSTDPKTVYEFAGAPHTYADLAAAIGSDVTTQQVSDADDQAGLEKTGLPKGVAGFITATQRVIREGGLKPTTNDLETVLGHPLTPLADAVKEVLK
ncbi:NAD(P)H-binding protein [Lacticaseibacillus sp. GG6-2]